MDETSDEVIFLNLEIFSFLFIFISFFLQITFLPESVEPICYNSIEAVIKDKNYNPAQINEYIDQICSLTMSALIGMNKPFKYIVNCVIMQKNGAGLNSSHSCYWDRTNDNCIVVKWPSEKRKDPNARMVCILSVYGLSS